MPGTSVRLEAAMESRRVELRMSWRDVTRAADMSYEGLRAIRRGERYPNPVTRARIESALKWGPGSVEVILAGGDPLPLADEEPPSEEQLADRVRNLEEQLAIMQAALDRLNTKPQVG